MHLRDKENVNKGIDTQNLFFKKNIHFAIFSKKIKFMVLAPKQLFKNRIFILKTMYFLAMKVKIKTLALKFILKWKYSFSAFF
jgi:hypothetical protein